MKTPSQAQTVSTGGNDLQLINPSSPNTAVSLPSTLHDIQPPIELPEPTPYLLYGSIALASLIAAGLFFYLLHRKKNEPAPVIPPGVLARSELMEARSLITEATTLKYMDRVSNILRRYIEARFSLSPTRQTTREFFQSVSAQGGNSPLTSFREELKQCLERCDMAKYAHQPAQLDHLQSMEDAVLGFINTTADEIPGEEASS